MVELLMLQRLRKVLLLQKGLNFGGFNQYLAYSFMENRQIVYK